MDACREKRLDIEMMRILACFFVIFQHTGDHGVYLFSTYPMKSLQFWIYQFIGIFSKFSVPLFFAITGSLLLDREPEPLARLYRHRVLKMVRILVIWSFFYYLVEVLEGRSTFSLPRFFGKLYDGGWNYSYWYLYAYITLLIILPVLQRIARHITDQEYLYIFAVVLIFNGVIPLLQFRLFQGRYALNRSVDLSWFLSYTFLYPIVGYFLSCRTRSVWNRKRILCTRGPAVLSVCICNWLRGDMGPEEDTGTEKDTLLTFVSSTEVS